MRFGKPPAFCFSSQRSSVWFRCGSWKLQLCTVMRPCRILCWLVDWWAWVSMKCWIWMQRSNTFLLNLSGTSVPIYFTKWKMPSGTNFKASLSRMITCSSSHHSRPVGYFFFLGKHWKWISDEYPGCTVTYNVSEWGCVLSRYRVVILRELWIEQNLDWHRTWSY